ncbi:MAG: M10 family metallopeptidase C-terminal domain-containing protein, partial [Rhodospirillales bacterium]|nr:M10 family metallopeptidase C-terminal domain-containing protein [Rhodospirillales bacterium]
ENTDRMIGYASNDTLTGLGGDDTLWGTDGNDVLDGGDGNDVLLGEWGADTLTGGAGADVLNGGSEADVYRYTASADSTTTATDTIQGFVTGVDRIEFAGMAGIQLRSTPYTYAGSVAATVANIQFDDGAANKAVFFSNGTDGWLYISGPGTGTNFNGTLITLAGVIAMPAVADLTGVVVEPTNLTLTGTAGNDTLTGGAGNDTLDGGAGDDKLIGGGGNNLFLASGGNDTIIAGSGTDTLEIGAAFHVMNAELQDADGDSAVDDLRLTLDQSGVASTITVLDHLTNPLEYLRVDVDGVTGFETLRVATSFDASASTERMAMAGTAGGDLIVGSAYDDVVFGSGGNDSIQGGGGNDYLFGGEGTDSIGGGTGNDTVVGGGSGDWLEGGTGIDTADYSEGATSGILVDLAVEAAFDDGQGAGDSLVNFEAVIGTDYADTIVGSALNETLLGLGGNDTLVGGAGNDALDGGTGLDTLDYSQAGSGVSVNLGTGIASDGNGGTDGVVDFEKVIGSDYNDVLVGSVGNDAFIGGLGADNLTGGAGNDTFIYQSLAESDPGPNDQINDFDIATDHIDLSAIPEISLGYLYKGSDGFDGGAFFEVAFDDGTDCLQVDTNGDTVKEMEIVVTGADSSTIDGGIIH